MNPITNQEIRDALHATPKGTFMRKRVIAKHIAKKRIVEELGVESFSDLSFRQRRMYFDPLYREIRRILKDEMQLRSIPGVIRKRIRI